jgi:hypothetical protein
MVCGISWLESWVKFESQYLKNDRKIAIDVGRHVFTALSLIEIPFAACSTYFAYSTYSTYFLSSIIIAPICLAIQAVLIRPSMRSRSEMIVKGLPVPESKGVPAHLIFVGLEGVKTVALLFTAVALLNQLK